MKITRIKANIITLVVCISVLTQQCCYAQNASSEAEVKFVPGTGPTYPVNPENPEIDGNDKPVEGSLAIVSVSQFDFGTLPVTVADQYANNTTSRPNIQVVDLRGTATGWKVSAAVSRFTDGETETLPGAAVRIVDGRPNSISTSLAPAQIPNTLLTSDGEPTKVITAGNGAGTGLWVMRWYPSADNGQYITLEIPAGSATIGSHTAIINWILEDTI